MEELRQFGGHEHIVILVDGQWLPGRVSEMVIGSRSDIGKRTIREGRWAKNCPSGQTPKANLTDRPQFSSVHNRHVVCCQRVSPTDGPGKHG
jgi:hypothetical protein